MRGLGLGFCATGDHNWTASHEWGREVSLWQSPNLHEDLLLDQGLEVIHQ